MLLKDLKQEALMPVKKILLNKTFKLRGRDVLLALITSQEGKNVLWVLRNEPVADDLVFTRPQVFSTNRDELMHGISAAVFNNHLAFKEITIQGQKITVSSSSGQRLSHNNYYASMRIQHLWEAGIDTSVFDNMEMSEIMIYACEFNDGAILPQISTNPEGDIVLCIRGSHKEILAGGLYSFELGESPNGRFSFYDSENNRDRYFYINKLARYDIWDEIEKEGMKDVKYMKAMENICPKGYVLPVVEYETEDDIQLQFYDKAFLDSEPERRSDGFHSVLLLRNNNIESPHGFKTRTCALKPVAKDYAGSLPFELLSWFLEIPEETIWY